MKRTLGIVFLVITLGIGVPRAAHADFFGADIPLLVNILANSVQQLAQLQSILGNGKDSLDLIRTINQGINDSLNLMKTSSPSQDPGIYSSWQKSSQALEGIQGIYGTVVPSADEKIQHDSDVSTAEAITMNNAMYHYAAQIDDIGEDIKRSSHETSPGGAQKLTAETLGVMLHVMNQSLRAQATGLKMQAQMLAIQNHKEKEGTRRLLSDSESLTSAMKSQNASFSIPRF